MTNEEWINTLGADPVLRSVIPMELQAGMPMPWMCRDRLLLYVPFYCVSPTANGVNLSEKLFEVNFAAVTKQIVSIKDLRFLSGASAENLAAVDFPSSERLEEQEMILQDLLHQLDKIETAYRRMHSVKEQALQEYYELLMASQLWQEQAQMYRGVSE